MSYFFYFLGCLFLILIIVFFIQKRETLVNPVGETGANGDLSQDPNTIDLLFSTPTSQPTTNTDGSDLLFSTPTSQPTTNTDGSDLLFGGLTETPFPDSTEDPYRRRQQATEAPYEGATEDLYRGTEAPFGATEGPFGATEAPFGATEAPFGATEAPFGATEAPFGATEAPFPTPTAYRGEPSDVSDLPPPFGGDNVSLDSSLILSTTQTPSATVPVVTTFDLTTDDIAVNTVAPEEVLSRIPTTPALVEITPPRNVMMASVNSELSVASSTTTPSATPTVSATVSTTSPPTEAPTVFMSSWSFWENKDYPKNNLPGPFKNRFVRQTTNSCQNLCDRNSNCVGIVTNFQGANQRGDCWLKKNMASENAVYQPNRFARKKIKVPYTSK